MFRVVARVIETVTTHLAALNNNKRAWIIVGAVSGRNTAISCLDKGKYMARALVGHFVSFPSPKFGNALGKSQYNCRIQGMIPR